MAKYRHHVKPRVSISIIIIIYYYIVIVIIHHFQISYINIQLVTINYLSLRYPSSVANKAGSVFMITQTH